MCPSRKHKDFEAPWFDELPAPVDGKREQFKSELGAYTFDRNGLTVDGQGINLNDYCLSLCNIEQTYVLLF